MHKNNFKKCFDSLDHIFENLQGQINIAEKFQKCLFYSVLQSILVFYAVITQHVTFVKVGEDDYDLVFMIII